MSGTKKLVSVLATSALITGARGEDMIILERVPYIHYLVQFRNGSKKVTRVLINSDSEANAMTQAYIKQLGLWIWQTNVEAQKIYSFFLKTFEIVIVKF